MIPYRVQRSLSAPFALMDNHNSIFAQEIPVYLLTGGGRHTSVQKTVLPFQADGPPPPPPPPSSANGLLKTPLQSFKIQHDTAREFLPSVVSDVFCCVVDLGFGFPLPARKDPQNSSQSKTDFLSTGWSSHRWLLPDATQGQLASPVSSVPQPPPSDWGLMAGTAISGQI